MRKQGAVTVEFTDWMRQVLGAESKRLGIPVADLIKLLLDEKLVALEAKHRSLRAPRRPRRSSGKSA